VGFLQADVALWMGPAIGFRFGLVDKTTLIP